ncbi:MAG TPA: hypothetical protein VE197_01495 [Mycobacterium sp.]|nr:hypothetical protein [Mycobacterium sp.]
MSRRRRRAPHPPSSPIAEPTTEPTLRPGPHSAIGDVDLPAGTTVQRSSTDPNEELWHYVASYAETVAYLQAQFATGRHYDSYGATWWGGLPPCYNLQHQSPPLGGWRFGGPLLDVVGRPADALRVGFAPGPGKVAQPHPDRADF